MAIARQQAKIAQLQQEILNAKESDHRLEPMFTSKNCMHMSGHAADMDIDPPQSLGVLGARLQGSAQQSAAQQGHQQHLSGNHSQPHSQRSVGMPSSQPDAAMTEIVNSSDTSPDQQSVWL